MRGIWGSVFDSSRGDFGLRVGKGKQMGTYLNPGNSGFEKIRNSIYVDKTGLIGLMNRTIGTVQKLTCISRPRRFGKSFAAQMLCAYYDKTCDSAALFDDLDIASDGAFNDTYEKHLNQYDVIYLDMTNIMGEMGKDGMVSRIRRKLTEELVSAYPSLQADDESLSTTLIRAADFRFLGIFHAGAGRIPALCGFYRRGCEKALCGASSEFRRGKAMV